VPRPEDFPRHTAAPHFDLHWRVTREDSVARAVGIVVPTVSDFSSLTLQLRALDTSGRAVSSALAPVARRAFGTAPNPFEIRLRLRGQEADFEVWVWESVLVGDQMADR